VTLPTPKPRKPAKAKVNKKATKAKGKGKKGTIQGESLLKSSSFTADGHDLIGQMILDDLMANDPITDRLQNPVFNVEPEPTISGRMRKDTQFQRLFANVPDGNSLSMKVAKDDRKKLKEASKSFGFAQCKAMDGKWIIKGMKSTLYHHQLLGAQWMLQRELSSQPPNGGLLADSMGLGKTVQMLACMVGNPPTEGKSFLIQHFIIFVPC
jgi:SNF2 family DNA or RNA helicase